jgi:predicted nucleotidyltransferase
MFEVEEANEGETMKSLDEIRATIKQHGDILAQKYGVAVVSIFGSYVRNEQGVDSDLDLLAEVLRPVSLLEIVGAEIYLDEILGVKVDLVLRRNVRKELRETVLMEAIEL